MNWNKLWFLHLIVELEEEVAETSNVNDIPTTIIRSKADVVAGASSAASLSNSTNDIVINKLTQILSYLRAGKCWIYYSFRNIGVAMHTYVLGRTETHSL